MAIKKDTQRQVSLTAKGGQVTPVFFNDVFSPNVFQVTNYGSNTIYISDKQNVTQNFYELSIVSNTKRVLTIPIGVKVLYVYAVSDSQIFITSFVDDNIQPNALVQDQSVSIQNNTVSNSVSINAPLPAGTNNIGHITFDNTSINVNNVDVYTPIKITLVANTDYVLKGSAGKVSNVSSTLTDVTLKNGSTVVWGNLGNISFPFPVTFTTNITLNSATGGVVYVAFQ